VLLISKHLILEKENSVKKLIKSAGISLVVLTAALSAQAAQAAQKIGYVDTALVFHSLPQVHTIQQKLEKVAKDRRAELDKLKSEVEAKMTKLKRDGQLMSPEQVDNLKIDIQSMQAKLEVKAKAFQSDMNKMQQDETQKVNEKIKKAIDAVAAKQGYDLVLGAQAAVYAKPELNLTDAVIKQLK